MRALPWIALLAIGCTGSGGDDTANPTDDTANPVDPFERYIYVTDPADGDFSGYTPGDPWLEQTVDGDLQTTGPGHGVIIDFESEKEVAEASLTVWHGDDVTASPDGTTTSDNNGEVDIELVACQPMAYLVATPPELDETKDTYEAHQISAAPGEDGVITAEFNSVSSVTYAIIPSLLGLSPDPAKSIIAGTAFDSLDEPIEGAQVIVKDSSGEIIDGVYVKYFVDNFPTRDQEWTSADGLWVAVDVPVGEVTVELYAVLEAGGEPQLLGATVLQSYADSINISNIYTGYGDGVKYPESCLASE